MSFYTRSHKDRWFGRKIGETTTVSIGVAVTQSIIMATGFYRAIGTVACHLLQADQGNGVTTSDYYLPAGMEAFFMVDVQYDSNVTGVIYAGASGQRWLTPGRLSVTANDVGFVSVIRAGAANGTLYITKISDLGDLNADVT